MKLETAAMLVAIEDEDWQTAAGIIARHFDVEVNLNELQVYNLTSLQIPFARAADSLLLYPIYGYRFEWHSDMGFIASLSAQRYYSDGKKNPRAQLRDRPVLEVFRQQTLTTGA